MKSAVELNSLLLKFVFHFTWFDQRQNGGHAKEAAWKIIPKDSLLRLQKRIIQYDARVNKQTFYVNS